MNRNTFTSYFLSLFGCRINKKIEFDERTFLGLKIAYTTQSNLVVRMYKNRKRNQIKPFGIITCASTLK